MLAEVCVALRFAGAQPSAIWEDMLRYEARGFSIQSAQGIDVPDAYHEYFVTSWWAELAGQNGFMAAPVSGGIVISRQTGETGPLRAISEMLYQLGNARSGDWQHMRQFLEGKLGERQQTILVGAEQSSDQFGQFFEQFSRVCQGI